MVGERAFRLQRQLRGWERGSKSKINLGREQTYDPDPPTSTCTLRLLTETCFLNIQAQAKAEREKTQTKKAGKVRKAKTQRAEEDGNGEEDGKTQARKSEEGGQTTLPKGKLRNQSCRRCRRDFMALQIARKRPPWCSRCPHLRRPLVLNAWSSKWRTVRC